MKKLFFLFVLLAFNFISDNFYSADAADPFYEACRVPKKCGDQTISFPFFIQGQQESYCGYPGFNLSCDPNGRSILNLSGQNYVVRQIFYHNRSVIVSNAALLDPEENGCITSVPNLTLSSDFKIAEGQNSVVLLFNCRASSSVRGSNPLLNYKIGCYAENQANSVLAIYESDGDQLAQASRMCGPIGDVVVANTTAVDGYMGGMLMREVLRRGFMLTWLASDCGECERSGGKCGFIVPSFHFRCFCPDMPHARKCSPPSGLSKQQKLGLGLGVVVAFGGIGTVVVMLIYRFRKKHNHAHQSIEAFLKNCGPLQIRRYSYSNIKKMTNSFKEKLGQGGFGSVYKGKLHDGHLVAVKMLNKLKANDGEDFINEVAAISRTSHVNVVRLLGFCFEGAKKALIYEFMPNGSLEKFVYDENETEESYQLDWETYYQISLGTARGLEYLHRGCNRRILHFDIKPHNILLDANFMPKISDFGLAKICTRKDSVVSMLGPRGTIGYIAPEVFCRSFGGVSHKSDVYSYGMMVLEMVGGRKNVNIRVDNSSELYFPQWIYERLKLKELGLKRIISEEDNVKSRKMIMTSLWCIQTDPSSRPTMSRVIEMLEGSLDFLKVPPKPFLSSPPRSSPFDPYMNMEDHTEGTGSGYLGVLVFSYKQLAKATDNFNAEKILRHGSSGAVYHGKLKDGREVAVKRLYEQNYKRVREQVQNEIEILTRLRHKNLVSLYGCTSRHCQELLLVYKYIPNGTVADHLHGDRVKTSPLTWPIRLSIAIETASALVYLHASDVVHRDVQTNNILLDNNFCVKVSDFGLSRLFPIDVTHVSATPQGTPGYVDPEYFQCYQLTSKSDVYSFGVVLIELLSSMPAIDMTRHRREIYLANLAISKIQTRAYNELIDQDLGFDSNTEVRTMTIAVAELAFECLQQDKEMRPTMDEVLERLRRIKDGKI